MKTNRLKLGLNFFSRFTSYLKPVTNLVSSPYNKKPVSSSSTKFVLSFDGGGVRGLAAAVFLKALEKETGLSISKHFDLFMGVSAGGLSASFLAFNQTSAEELEVAVNVIVKNELQAIVNLGGVLGVVVGLFQMILLVLQT